MPDFEPFSQPFPRAGDHQIGQRADLFVLEVGDWLKDTQVLYRLSKRKSIWKVYLMFIWVKDPFQFTIKYLTQYSSQRKAVMHGQFFQRSVGRDARGTLQANRDAFFICLN